VGGIVTSTLSTSFRAYLNFSTAGRVKHVVILPTRLKKSLNVYVYTARREKNWAATTASVLKFFRREILAYTVFRFVRILAEILAIFQQRIRTKKLPNVYVVHYRMFADYTIMCVTFLRVRRRSRADTLTFLQSSDDSVITLSYVYGGCCVFRRR